MNDWTVAGSRKEIEAFNLQIMDKDHKFCLFVDNVGTETKAAVAIEDTESVFGEETVLKWSLEKKQSLERSSHWNVQADS